MPRRRAHRSESFSGESSEWIPEGEEDDLPPLPGPTGAAEGAGRMPEKKVRNGRGAATEDRRLDGRTYVEPSNLLVISSAQSERQLPFGIEDTLAPLLVTLIDGQLAVVQCGGGRVRFWTEPQGETNGLDALRVSALGVSSLGHRVVLGTQTGEILVWGTRERAVLCDHRPNPLKAATATATCVAISQNGTHVAVHTSESAPTLYRAVSLAAAVSQNQVAQEQAPSSENQFPLANEKGRFRLEFLAKLDCQELGNRKPNMMFFGNGLSEMRFGVCYGDATRSGVANMYEVPTSPLPVNDPLMMLSQLNSHSAGIVSADMDRMAVTGSLDGKGCSWRLDTFKTTSFLSHPTAITVQLVYIFPGDQYIVTCASDHCVRVWGAYPWFDRSERGFAPLVARCDPPASMQGFIRAVLLTANLHTLKSIMVVWLCEAQGENTGEEPLATRKATGAETSPRAPPQSETSIATEAQPAESLIAPKPGRLVVLEYALPLPVRQRLVSTLALAVSLVVTEWLQGQKNVRRNILRLLF